MMRSEKGRGGRGACAVLVGLLLCLAGCTQPPDIKPLAAEIADRPARVETAIAGTPFGEAVARAVAESPALGRSDANLREREAGLLAQRGAFVPQLSLGLRPAGGADFAATGFVSVSQLVFDAGSTRAARRAAQARVLGGVAGKIDAGAQSALSAVEAWAEVVTARRLAEVSQEALEALQKTVARIEERASAGAGANSELLVAQSRMANERVAVAEVMARLARAEAVFAEAFGMAPPAGAALPPVAPPLPADAAASSPILLQARAEVLAAEADVASAKARFFPAISAQATQEKGQTTEAGPSAEQLVAPQRSQTSRYDVALARLAARQADLQATQDELESRLRIIGAEQSAVRARQSAAKAAVEANRENLLAARDQFDIGRRSLIELLDAEREALASERMRIEADKAAILLGYAGLAVTGDIVDVFGIDLGIAAPKGQGSGE